MSNEQRPALNIRITGTPGSGKSTLLHLVGDFLNRANYAAQCYDEGYHIKQPDAASYQPPALTGIYKDGGRITIKTPRRPVRIEVPAETPNTMQMVTRLLEASEAMTTYLQQHTEELARGEEPHVFTATDHYAELQEATQDLRHALELGAALEASSTCSRPTRALDGLLAMHGLMLEHNPYAYFELAYTRKTGWMAWICDKPQSTDSDRKVLASGQGDTPEEACDAALEQLTEPVGGAIQANEIPY